MSKPAVFDRAGRVAWFKTTILPHEAALRRHLRRLGMGAADVDDMIAEALLRAYTASDWSRIDQGRSYLFAIVRNLILDAARRRRVVAFDPVADVDLLHVPDEQPTADAIVTAREELRNLQEAMNKLPDRLRQILILRRIEELPMATIADRVGLSVSTVEKHLAKAMHLLTAALAECEPANRTTKPWQTAISKR